MYLPIDSCMYLPIYLNTFWSNENDFVRFVSINSNTNRACGRWTAWLPNAIISKHALKKIQKNCANKNQRSVNYGACASNICFLQLAHSSEREQSDRPHTQLFYNLCIRNRNLATQRDLLCYWLPSEAQSKMLTSFIHLFIIAKLKGK